MIRELFEREQSFFEEYKSCCTHNCVRQILEYYGLEHAHLLFNTSYGFKVVQDPKTLRVIVEREPEALLVGDLNQYIKHGPKDNMTVENIITEDQSLIQENIPIIIDVDICYLNYDKHYHLDHCLHSILFCGIDGENAYVVDVGERISYRGTISFDDYKKARTSSNPKCDNLYSGQPIECRETYIEPEIVAHVDYRNVVLCNLLEVQKYYKTKGYGIDNVHLLDKMFHRLIEREEKLTDEEIEEMYYQLYSINRKRKLFLLELKMIEEKWPEISTSLIRHTMEEILQCWKSILSILLKLRFVRNHTKSYQKISEYINNSYSKEEDINCLLDQLVYDLNISKRDDENET